MINSRLYTELQLIVHTATGPLDSDELERVGVAMYQLDPPPLFSLWDLSNADMAEFTLDKIESFQSSAADTIHGRTGGKTAIVAPADVEFGAARQYVSFADSLKLPFEHSVFRTVEEAMTWLDIDITLVDEESGVDCSV